MSSNNKYVKELLDKLTEKLKMQTDKNKSNKKSNIMTNIIIVVLFGVLIMLVGSSFKGMSDNTKSAISSNVKSETKQNVTTKNQDMENDDETEYESNLQNDLKETLSKIDGVGKVSVMIYFEAGEEQVPAVNINDSTSNTQEKDNQGGVRKTTQKNNGSTVVITNEGDGVNKPLIVKKYKPKVTGVCVVAEGADNDLTQLRIKNAVINLFNLTEEKVNVYPMKK